MRVLVSGGLTEFLEAETVPADIAVEIVPDGSALPAGDFSAIMPHVGVRVAAADIERMPALRVIANFGVGYDNIDVEAARARGIVVTNTPGVLTDATAELTWALILAVARRVGEGERLVRSGTWTGWTPTQLLGNGLSGGLLGVIGAGRIGREVARRAGVFGMRVAYWSRRRDAGWERETGAQWLDLDDLLAQSDVVSLHVPFTAQTRHLIDERALAHLKDGAVLVNTSRGAVVEEAALVAALGSGRIRAALDVYEYEPRVPEALCALDNVVLLPHIGSATRQARSGMWRLAWTNMLAVLEGRTAPNAI